MHSGILIEESFQSILLDDTNVDFSVGGCFPNTIVENVIDTNVLDKQDRHRVEVMEVMTGGVETPLIVSALLG